MERAAQIKAERQAHLRERRTSGDTIPPLEGIEGIGRGPHAQPPAAAGVWHGADVPSAPRRTSSQPTSDLPNGGGGPLPMRPNSEAAGGHGNALPEWARDFNANRIQRGGGGGFGDPYDGLGLGLDHDAVNYPDSPSPQPGPSGFDSPPTQMPYAGVAPAYAAAAASWPADMPLNQSEGGIGYQARRAMPRGPLPSEMDQQVGGPAVDCRCLPQPATRPTHAPRVMMHARAEDVSGARMLRNAWLPLSACAAHSARAEQRMHAHPYQRTRA